MYLTDRKLLLKLQLVLVATSIVLSFAGHPRAAYHLILIGFVPLVIARTITLSDNGKENKASAQDREALDRDQ
jgi:hypothetical protein